MSLRWTPVAATLGALALAVAASPAPPVRADDKSLAPFYVNKIVGFRFRPLTDWATIPPGTDPDDPKVCGFYSDAAKYDRTVKPECTVYAFRRERSSGVATEPGTPGLGGDGGGDEKPRPASEAEARKMAMDEFRFKSTKEAVEKTLAQYQENAEQQISRQDEKKQKKFRPLVAKKPLVEREVKTEDGVLRMLETSFCMVLTNGRDLFFTEAKICAGYLESDDYEVGIVYQIPDDGWKKYAGPVNGSIRSLEFLQGADIAAARKDLEDALSGAKTDDARWLEEIKRKVTPGWDSLQTKNYLLVYDKVVKPDRVKALAIQIEAIRKDVYEVLFPPDRTVTAISVVRVCKDKEQYSAYGGPGGSAGYWNSYAQELVFYEDTSKKKDAFRVLNHEAFHQYIFYSVGSISPHDWFNEGHGDFFAGHNYSRSGKFIPAPFDWRVSEIKGAMGSKKFIPLKMFVTYSHKDYYGPQIGQNYAQGWSMIWFLRGSKNPAWKDILPNYFNTLKGEVTRWVNGEIDAAKKEGKYDETWKAPQTPDDVEEGARSKALAAAFGSFDDKTWARFEREWLDYKY